jgi:hypothetical protein
MSRGGCTARSIARSPSRKARGRSNPLTGACHALDSTWSMRDEWRPADRNRITASSTWARLSCAALSAMLGLLVDRGTAAAQELEPKAYSASPVGAAFLVAGLTRSSGAVVFDPTLPLEDVEARINTAMVATGYTFGLFGKLGLVTAALPRAWGDISGLRGRGGTCHHALGAGRRACQAVDQPRRKPGDRDA